MAVKIQATAAVGIQSGGEIRDAQLRAGIRFAVAQVMPEILPAGNGSLHRSAIPDDRLGLQLVGYVYKISGSVYFLPALRL